MNRVNSLPERLSKQRALVGLLQSQANPTLAEMAGLCGYDFVLLDGEHGVFTEEDYLYSLRTLASTNTLAWVRLGGHDLHALGRYLDMGVAAIVVPNVSTSQQAKVLVRAMEYAPTGTRGFGASLHRGTRYGLDLGAHLKEPRAGVSLLAIIESKSGVAHVEEILAVKGIDGVIVGPADLSADLGCPGDFSHASYAHAISRIERAAVASGKLLGTAPHPGYPLERLIAQGHQLLILDTDISLIREAMSAQLARARSSLSAFDR